jgi:2'-5' RNA ligase
MPSPQYALVAYVRNSVGEFVESLRREFHPKHAHLPAHISVLPPRLLQGSEQEALEIVERVCRDADPFEVALGEVASFTPLTPTVFLRLAHAGYRMRELHDTLNVGALYAGEPFPYMPHLTIFRMDTAEQAEPAYEEARRRWDEYTGSRRLLLEQLTFVRQAGEDLWTDLATVTLGRRLAHIR